MNIIRIFYAFDLKARIAIFTMALFVGAVWLLAHDLDEEVRDNLKDVLAAQQFQTVEHVATNFDEAVKLRINALADVGSIIRPEWLADRDQLHSFMGERVLLRRFFNRGLLVVSADGKGLADFPHIEGREGASYSERDFYRDVMATKKPVVSKPFLSRFTNKPTIAIAAPILNGRNDVVGILVGSNELVGSDFLSETMPSKRPDRGDLHIVSPRDGMVVTSTDPRRIMQPVPAPGVNAMYDRYRQGYEGSGVSVNSLGIENLSSAKRVSSTGWLVVATLPTSIAFAPLRAVQTEIYKDATLSSVVITLLLWLFLNRQLSPLSRSAKAIESMASGKQPLRPLRLEGSKEIRRLLSSFNRLQHSIGKQHKAELREREAARRAEDASRTKSNFLANMSHELRTPLNAIIGFSDAMGNQLFGPLSGKYLEYVEDIHQSGEHLLSLINDILDLSAIEAEKLNLSDDKVDLGHAVDSALRLIRIRAERGGVTLAASLTPDGLQVRADDRRFRQILLNLLSNAVKFTPTGGTVRIDACLRDGRLALSVTDTGIGMDAEGIAVALSPFGQVHDGYARTEQGTGLGLPLTRRLVELHGGELTIESRPGAGTTVGFWLPAERVLQNEMA